MSAFYNEIDPFAAAWLRELIKAGHIADGVVDERSIEDITPKELHGFSQCHFFAGIGVWSYALRNAGWPDDRPVWTGSCPCQPFSAAGKGSGFDDQRHLWPHFHWLIQECKPASVLGEQVASKDADPWIDLVQTDLEALGFAFGAVAFPSAGVGAPHIRDRTYWVAHTESRGRPGQLLRAGSRVSPGGAAQISVPGALAHGDQHGRGTLPLAGLHDAEHHAEPCGSAGGLAHSPGGRHIAGVTRPDQRGLSESNGGGQEHHQPGPTNGPWRDADWLLCRDGKWRPVEPRPQPLVDGSSEGLGRVCDSRLEEIEREVNAWSMESQVVRAEAMRDLLLHLGAEAKRCWTPRGLPGLHEAPFLLAFVRQLQEQGWRIAEGIALPGSQATNGKLRLLRDNEASSGSPCERGLGGQLPVEPSDAVRVLSCLLARHASEAWGEAYSAHAEIGFPLVVGATARVGRLRGYGNAINAKAAQVFIESVMEVRA